MSKISLVCSRIIAAAIGVIFLLAIGDSASARPYPLRQVDTIIHNGLLSMSYERDVYLVARQYARRTRFAGKVRVNQLYEEDSLNIYIFRYSRPLPRVMKNNCLTFSDFSLILCDRDLIDSMPRTPFKLSIEGSDQGYSIPLLFWLIGHEIGHAVFGHVQGAYAPGALPANGTAAGPKGLPSAGLTRDGVRQLNQFEVDADRLYEYNVMPTNWEAGSYIIMLQVDDKIYYHKMMLLN